MALKAQPKWQEIISTFTTEKGSRLQGRKPNASCSIVAHHSMYSLEYMRALPILTSKPRIGLSFQYAGGMWITILASGSVQGEYRKIFLYQTIRQLETHLSQQGLIHPCECGMDTDLFVKVVSTSILITGFGRASWTFFTPAPRKHARAGLCTCTLTDTYYLAREDMSLYKGWLSTNLWVEKKSAASDLSSGWETGA